jgi:hypothetical protein
MGNNFQSNLNLPILKHWKFIGNWDLKIGVLLLVFYTILAIIITFPLVLNFNSSIYSLPQEYVLKAKVPYSTPVRNADAYGTIWELWWKKQAFLQGLPENFSPLLGISGMKTDAGLFHMPIVNAEAKWLTVIFNEVFAYNLLILLSFPLAGIAMYLLAFYLTRDKRAAALAGFIFAFAPLHRRYAFEWEWRSGTGCRFMFYLF